MDLAGGQADMFSTNPATANLSYYYNFDYGVGGAKNAGINTLSDLSSNANNGTLRGLALNGNASN